MAKGLSNRDSRMRDRWERRREQKDSPASKIRKQASPLRVIAEPRPPAPPPPSLPSQAEFAEFFHLGEVSDITWAMQGAEIVMSLAQYEAMMGRGLGFTPLEPPTPEETIAVLEKKCQRLEANALRYHQRCDELYDRICTHAQTIQLQDRALNDIQGVADKQKKEIERLKEILSDRDDIRVTLDHEYRFEERYV